ncbi:MAG TPA: c-type cytochrome domain-containing protein, partial [Verrucomicrobiae bacterium]
MFITCLSFVCSQAAPAPDFSQIQTVFDKHCTECHDAQDPEAMLVLESFEGLLKGGESGPAIVPGKSAESLLLKMIEGKIEKDGKKKIMPPGKREKLSAEEIASIKSWIDSGAAAPMVVNARELVLPKIAPKVPPRNSIFALAYAPGPKLVGYARSGEVEIRSAEDRRLVRTLKGHQGAVNALVFSVDGKQLFAAGGEAGLVGEVRQWEVGTGKLLHVFEGHRDALYAVALSPDGKTLATGGYDQKIKLWNVKSGEQIRMLSGHNGAVFGLSFRADGKILASASADRTVKLWEVATGERRDTLSQSLKELYSVAFSPDGKRLAAAGVDNRIRVWEISEKAEETTNPLLHARFAHEGAILRIAYSSDGKLLLSSAADRTVKIWETTEMKERLVLPVQPDWPPALSFAGDSRVVVGCLDGTSDFYDTMTGKVVPPPKPELTHSEPRGVQRGMPTTLKLFGSNLVNLTELKFNNAKLAGKLLLTTNDTAKVIWASITPGPDLPRGAYEISVNGAGGESGKIKIYVDDIPQITEIETNSAPAHIPSLPASCWGVINPMGDVDDYEFSAKAGETLVFDVNAKILGSKANAVLTLFDASGKVLASNNDFDGNDPFIAYKFTEAGTFKVRVSDLQIGASPDNFYRLSIGSFPYVVGSYPISVGTNKESEVELLGYNLPPDHKIKVKPGKAGEIDLPVDPE